MHLYIPEHLRDETDRELARALYLYRISSSQYRQLTQTIETTKQHHTSFRKRSATDIANITDSHKLTALNFNESCDINTKDCLQNTPLHLMAYFNRIDWARTFPKGAVNPNIANNLCLTPLHLSVMSNTNNSFSILLYEYGANPDCLDIANNSPLHYSCRIANLKMTEILISQFGSNLEQKNNMGQTPLIAAVEADRNEIVERLLQANVDVNYHDYLIRRSALIAATLNGNLECVIMLLNAGADIEIIDATLQKKPVDIAKDKVRRENSRGKRDKAKEYEKVVEVLRAHAESTKKISPPPLHDSLQSLCRQKVRKALNNSSHLYPVHEKVKFLQVPPATQNYLAGIPTPSSSDEHQLISKMPPTPDDMHPPHHSSKQPD